MDNINEIAYTQINQKRTPQIALQLQDFSRIDVFGAPAPSDHQRAHFNLSEHLNRVSYNNVP